VNEREQLREGLGVDANVKTTMDRVDQDREKIPEDMAEDHARLLAIIRNCLAEIGITASLTTFHHLVLRAETYHAPARYEPELDVFRSDEERPGIALRVKLTKRGDETFYSWGVSWICSHPASDPVGAVQVIADAALAA
jgi:hypothetical protein